MLGLIQRSSKEDRFVYVLNNPTKENLLPYAK
jgi:hypothetical protein